MKVPCGGFDLDESVFNVDKNSKQVKLNSPISYDYMPEGYPSKSIGTVTLMEEQEVSPFTDGGGGAMLAVSPVVLELADGEKLTVVWDGVSYDTVVTMVQGYYLAFGNLGTGDTTDCPFAYVDMGNGTPMWTTTDTATSHTIKVTATKMIYNTIDVNMLPKAGEDYGVVKKDEIVTAYVFPNAVAPQVEMNKAIDDFIAGKASITWGAAKIIYAERPSDTEILVRLSNNPTIGIKCVASKIGSESYYNKSSGGYYNSESSMTGIQLYNYGDPSIGSTAIRASIDSNNSANNHVSFGTWASIYEDGIAIKSSDSSKMFKITVNDSGTISATEVT